MPLGNLPEHGWGTAGAQLYGMVWAWLGNFETWMAHSWDIVTVRMRGMVGAGVRARVRVSVGVKPNAWSLTMASMKNDVLFLRKLGKFL